jgi:hypothetical protein
MENGVQATKAYISIPIVTPFMYEGQSEKSGIYLLHLIEHFTGSSLLNIIPLVSMRGTSLYTPLEENVFLRAASHVCTAFVKSALAS